MINLQIVILAAGLSQRLGFAKQLILKNGQTLLAEKIQLALTFSPYVTVVIPQTATGNLSANALRQISREVTNFPVQMVLNPEPQRGMSWSIKLAYQAICQSQRLERIETVTNTRVLFLTIDQVALTGDNLYQLCQTALLTSATEVLVSRYLQDSSFSTDNFPTANFQKSPPVWGVPVTMPLAFLADFVAALQGDSGFGMIFKRYQQTAQVQSELVIASPNSEINYRVVLIDLPELAWDIDTLAQFEALKDKFGLAVPKID